MTRALVSVLTVSTALAACSREEASTDVSPPRPDDRRSGSAAEHATTPSTPSTQDEPATRPASVATPPATPKVKRTPERPRVYAKTRYVWIREAASSELSWVGYLWIGGSAPVRDEKPRSGPGCTGQWYPVEPRGFVCVNGEEATLDADDPVLAKLRRFAPKLDSAWPHQYGESRGLERRRALGNLDLLPELPRTLQEGRKRIKPLSTVAWSQEIDRDDGSWLLTADYVFVPKAKVEPYPKVTFRGVRIGEDARMPLAFFRGENRPRYRRANDGAFEKTDEEFERLSHVELTGREETTDDETFLETRDGEWVREEDAVVPEPSKKQPRKREVADPHGKADTWIEVSVWDGWLIAYEGDEPVYVTMVSPGRGGTPVPNKDPLETASTPTGTFRITGKFATATMVAPYEFIHADVPWTQNFTAKHALHSAYWHDDWGNRKSAGCINVSPLDGKWLYEFTGPRVPEGWHGVRWLPDQEPATALVVHR